MTNRAPSDTVMEDAATDEYNNNGRKRPTTSGKYSSFASNVSSIMQMQQDVME